MRQLTFKPVTKATKVDFEALFGAPGAPKYCWCMVWRATPDEGRRTGSADRHDQMLQRIAGEVPVGLLGYDAGQPAAWVSIAPKPTFRRLGGPEPEDGENVWSLTCMYAHKTVRGQGIAHQLIAAAIAHARHHGADTIEAYPVAPDSPSYRFMGFVPAFEHAGFKAAGKAGPRRHVMRLSLDC
ncbi:MAG TPA: GNAT family N-acetyltransferase [Devosiaceae bacterium]|jgi:GNAT superfamily N-acetyltransferase